MNNIAYTILKWTFIGVFVLLNVLLLFGVISIKSTLVKVVYWGSIVATVIFGQLSGQNISTKRIAISVILILAFAILLSIFISTLIDN